MKRISAILTALVLAVCLALAGCANKAPSNADYALEPAYDSSESFAKPGASSTSAPADALSDSSDPFVGRKVIRNAALDVETLEFDSFISAVLGKTNALGGYIQSNNIRNHSYSQKNLRTADMVLRIPAERLDEFLETVNGVGNVTSQRESSNDVTDSYTDVEARLASLRTEYETLLGMLEKAETLQEIITLQDRLTDVRTEIESYEARKRSYDSQIAFSTVTLKVSEVERETAVEEETFGQETSRRFRESLEDVGNGFRSFAIWLIGNLPSILVNLFFFVGVPLIIVLIIIRSVRRKRKKLLAERQKEEEKKNNSAE